MQSSTRDKLKNLGIAVEKDEYSVPRGKASNPQSTQAPTITVISSIEQKCEKEKMKILHFALQLPSKDGDRPIGEMNHPPILSDSPRGSTDLIWQN